jgi:hypothetical protein
MTNIVLQTPQLNVPISKKSNVVVWLPTFVGACLFAAAWSTKSPGIMNAAAGVSTVGLAWVPVAMAMQRRLATMSRGKLLLGLVLIVQGMHTVEHLVQIIESYRLDFPPVRSLGIVSSLNVEWVHFGWNWLAWAGMAIAWFLGVRSWAMTLLFAWLTAHSLEHTYMLVRYLEVMRQMDRLKLPKLGSSEVLPGVLGRDGWISLHAPATRKWLGPLTSAPRVAIHLWWNVGEVAFLILACSVKAKSERVLEIASGSAARSRKEKAATPS